MILMKSRKERCSLWSWIPQEAIRPICYLPSLCKGIKPCRKRARLHTDTFNLKEWKGSWSLCWRSLAGQNTLLSRQLWWSNLIPVWFVTNLLNGKFPAFLTTISVFGIYSGARQKHDVNKITTRKCCLRKYPGATGYWSYSVCRLPLCGSSCDYR